MTTGRRSLDDRAFVVFGGSGGIGSALARRLADRGARLLAHLRPRAKA